MLSAISWMHNSTYEKQATLTQLCDMQKTAAVLVLLFAAACQAQTRGPATIDVPVGRLASVPIVLDADESDYVILGANVDGLREYDPDPKKLRLRVIGYEPGVAWIVVSSQKGGKLQGVFTCKVVVGGGGPLPPPVPPVPPVPPGPNPVPPGPLDPLASAIKAAAAADGFLKLKDLAMGFRTCGALIERASTVAELQASTTAALLSAVGDMKGKAPRLRVILAKELDTLPEAGALTPDIKARASAIFTTLANACEGASK
jgi:hypothetical protein